MATKTKSGGVAGPIVLLYLGYFAAGPVIFGLIFRVSNPQINWADDWNLDSAFLIVVLGVAGTAAFVSGVKLLADIERFHGFAATRNSTAFRKVLALAITGVVLVAGILTATGAVAVFGLLTPLALGWAAVNALRLSRSLAA